MGQYMTALEHVMSSYEEEFMEWCEDEGLPQTEGTAVAFLEETEGIYAW